MPYGCIRDYNTVAVVGDASCDDDDDDDDDATDAGQQEVTCQQVCDSQQNHV